MRPLKSILGNDPNWRPILSRAQRLLELQQDLASMLPLPFASYVQISDLHMGTLDIIVANAAIAAKLRQSSAQLISHLQDRGYEVSGIRIKVQVTQPSPPAKPVRHKLNQAGLQKLMELDTSLGNSPLKSALSRMIKSAKL